MPARVVVVRDDPAREVIVEALSDAGINVAAFDNPSAALDAIGVDGQCEILVTKFTFGSGNQNGISLAMMLKMKRLGLKVLFVGRDEYRQFAEGIGEHIPAEPLDLPLIVATVQRVLGEGRKP